MSVSYTNQALTVQTALFDLLVAEFTEFDVVYEEMFNPEYLTKQKYCRMYLQEDRQVSKDANGITREYEFQVALYFNLEHFQERLDFAIYSDTAERLKQLIETYNVHQPSSVYKWHEADVVSIVYPVGLQEIEEIEGFENIRAVYFQVVITRSNFWS